MRFGAAATLIPGLAMIAIGLALLVRVPVEGQYVRDVLPVMLLIGVGGGLVFPSIFTLALSSAGPSDSGLASGLINTSQQVGGALGLAVLASLSTTRSDSLMSGGDSTASALTSGYQLAFAVGAGLVILAIVLAALLLRSPEEAVAVETTEAETALAQEEAA
jgi:MFS family permease